jgi:hypothetical protein
MKPSSPYPSDGNVTPLRPSPAPAGAAAGPRAEAARYVAQMTLELEQLANTAGLDLAGYFLSLARLEAEMATQEQASPAPPPETQASYRAE